MPLQRLVTLLLAAGYALAVPTHVLDTDFPDPAVIQTDQGYYAFGTQGNGLRVQVAHSDDFTTWSLLNGTDAIPGPFPEWVNQDKPQIWAPDVIQRDDIFIMYYCAVSRTNGNKHCVAAATSSSIEGPYTPEADPIACHTDEGGAIDPTGFQDEDGTRYILYKVDGNSLNEGSERHPTPLMLQKLQSDGLRRDGDPVAILDRDDGDGPLVEAPSLVKVDGIYYLTFSSNMYNTLAYDVSYATASAVEGPYTKAKHPDAPLLVSGDAGSDGDLGGPGGADFLDGGRIVFHAFNNGKDLGDGRGVWIADIAVGDGKITVQ